VQINLAHQAERLSVNASPRFTGSGVDADYIAPPISRLYPSVVIPQHTKSYRFSVIDSFSLSLSFVCPRNDKAAFLRPVYLKAFGYLTVTGISFPHPEMR
jgi:hypothetical protein